MHARRTAKRKREFDCWALISPKRCTADGGDIYRCLSQSISRETFNFVHFNKSLPFRFFFFSSSPNLHTIFFSVRHFFPLSLLLSLKIYILFHSFVFFTCLPLVLFSIFCKYHILARIGIHDFLHERSMEYLNCHDFVGMVVNSYFLLLFFCLFLVTFSIVDKSN